MHGAEEKRFVGAPFGENWLLEDGHEMIYMHFMRRYKKFRVSELGKPWALELSDGIQRTYFYIIKVLIA